MLRLMPLALVLAVPAGPALAHAGHLGVVAGHDHWVAGAAIGAAVVIGLYGALKGRRKPADSKAAPDRTGETETTEEEANA